MRKLLIFTLIIFLLALIPLVKADDLIVSFENDELKSKVNFNDIFSMDDEELDLGSLEIKNNFKTIGYNGVKHEIDLKNKLKINNEFDYSLIINIPSNEIRWNGENYKLTSKPIKLEPYFSEEFDRLIVPNIFFGEKDSRINFEDIGVLGGYALVYNNSVELRIDNINLKSYDNLFIDPKYYKLTDGFDVSSVGVSDSRGITTWDGSYFWVHDNTDEYMYKFDSEGNYISATSFSTSSTGADDIKGISIQSGENFWLSDSTGGDTFIYRTTNAGSNMSGGIDVYPTLGGMLNSGVYVKDDGTQLWITDGLGGTYSGNITRVSSSGSYQASYNVASTGAYHIRGITSNGTDFWVSDVNDRFIYHFDGNFNNISDGFSAQEFGAANALDITTNNSSKDFWLIDWADDYVYHISEASEPCDPWIEVGAIDGTREWEYSGCFSDTEVVSNFTQELNDALQSCTADLEGYCDIPITVHSNSKGKLEIEGINIYFNITEYIWGSCDDCFSGPTGTQFKVNIVATDGFLNSAWDESNSDFEIIDGCSPVVSLVSPEDNYGFIDDVTFNVSAIDNVGLSNCILYTDINGWLANDTKAFTGTYDSETWLWEGITQGAYVWNALCYDDDENSAWHGTNYTFTVYEEGANKFYVKNNTDTAAYFDDNGNIVLKGSCTSGGTCTASDNTFIIKDNGGNEVAHIDQYGNLCIETGDCTDQSASCDPTNDAYIVKNSTGYIVSYMDVTGDLCLTGVLVEDGNP